MYEDNLFLFILFLLFTSDLFMEHILSLFGDRCIVGQKMTIVGSLIQALLFVAAINFVQFINKD